MTCRHIIVLAALLLSACSATSGGGGGGVSYTAGTACSASILTDQCGAAIGHTAVVHCTNAVWVVTKDCNAGEACAVKGGVPTCVAPAGGGNDTTSGGDDGFVFDAQTTPTDIQTGKDTLDVQFVQDTAQPDDVAQDTGKDIAKDTGKDIKLDTGPTAATWGTCTLDDTACLQSCVPANCSDSSAACQNDASCTGYQTCNQGCNASPIQMPSQGGSPIPQNSGETQKDYCYRVCQAQAGPVGIALDESYIECVIGLCVDCGTSASAGITKAQCQSSCGLENYCLTSYNDCLQDSDCLNLYGCILIAADATAQNDCVNASSSNAQSLFSTLNDCLTANGKKCVAP